MTRSINFELSKPVISLKGATFESTGTNIGGMLPFSRSHETEADKIGVYIMAIAGYNPEEASKLWERMKTNSEGKKSPPVFLSTHPSNDSRIESLRKLAPSAKEEAEKFGVTSFRKIDISQNKSLNLKNANQ